VSRNQSKRSSPAKLVVYAMASTIGAMAAGSLLGALGMLWADEARVAVASLLALVAIGLAGLGLVERRLPLLQCDRETPQQWLHLGPLRWASLNGLVLGCGATTRLGFALWYVVPVTALVVGSPGYGALMYGAYGLTRGIGAAGILIAVRKQGGLNDVADWLFRRTNLAHLVTSQQLLLVGVVTAVAVGI